MLRKICPSGFVVDRRGSLAVWLALAAVPLLLCVGAGLDLGRSLNQKSRLQNAVDSAALAGAAAYVSSTSVAVATAAATNYMTNFKNGSGLAVTYMITPTTTTSGTTVTAFKMTVAASAPITNALMGLAGSASNTIGARATAQNPVYNMTINFGSFNSSAADLNTIAYYIVPTDNSVPALSSTTQIFSNAVTTNPGSVTIQLTASQSVGFLLTNTTGGKPVTTCRQILWYQSCTTGYPNGYGSNAYGGSQGSVHYFYSHLIPPSKLAYPSVSQNCSLQVVSGSATPSSGSCLSANSAFAAVNCAKASGLTLSFNWNDMGGSSDDKDYNDATYTSSCSLASAGAGKGLVLTN